MALEESFFDSTFLLFHTLPFVRTSDTQNVESIVDQSLFDLAVQARVSMERRTVVYLREMKRGGERGLMGGNTVKTLKRSSEDWLIVMAH